MNAESSPENAYLFVYGTLMQGFTNPFAKKIRQNGTWLGKASFQGFLYDLGEYPGAIYDPQSAGKVHGEVWELRDFQKVIITLDRYEGVTVFNPEYVRQQISVVLENGNIISCWAYLFCQSVESFTFIPHGDYRKWLSDGKQHL
ncbi:gamma-glutamylcyclotransferase family protein [Runella sp.]|uniref:gamma-glutamylcyclotransferase family protein n=1 Tax=Runella sp. TaxID=1960881 RepID=UPI003D0960F2